MAEKCKSCSYTYPHIECVNCGDKYRNYSPYRKQTNADKIRSMSDEELALFIADWQYEDNSPKEILNWLRQPVKEETT